MACDGVDCEMGIDKIGQSRTARVAYYSREKKAGKERLDRRFSGVVWGSPEKAVSVACPGRRRAARKMRSARRSAVDGSYAELGRGARPEHLFKRLPRHVFAVAGVASALLVLASPAYSATAITTCGQTFTGEGYLVGDLDCSGLPETEYAVTIAGGGTLDLRGHELRRNGDNAIFCLERGCTITSDPPGGRLNGGINSSASWWLTVKVTDITFVADTTPIRVWADGPLTIRRVGIEPPDGDVHVVGRPLYVRDSVVGSTWGTRVRLVDSQCQHASGEHLLLRRSVVTGSDTDGVLISARGGAIVDSVITGNAGAGVRIASANPVKIVRTMITNNGEAGVRAASRRPVTIRDTTIDGNGWEGIFARYVSRLILIDSVVTNNGRDGLVVDQAFPLGREGSPPSSRFRRVTVTGNNLSGIVHCCYHSSRERPCYLRAVQSTFSNNAVDTSVCGVTQTCADIATCDPPRLADTTCEYSYDTNSGFPGSSWGVCSLD